MSSVPPLAKIQQAQLGLSRNGDEKCLAAAKEQANGVFMRQVYRCDNLNHRRSNAPVRYCPSCGEVVNASARSTCDLSKHALRRKSGDKFCIDCGKKLG